jgi:hypothetical protein
MVPFVKLGKKNRNIPPVFKKKQYGVVNNLLITAPVLKFGRF